MDKKMIVSLFGLFHKRSGVCRSRVKAYETSGKLLERPLFG